ncbi:MAG: septal ring lytic transglycosylase RlpA family protein [Verrucomicrobiales bacterium]
MITRLLALLCVFSVAACGPVYRGYQAKPYTVRGIRYYPMQPRDAVGFRERGIASWYNEHKFLWFGGTTSLGEGFKARALAGAHKTLPLPCRVRVRNLQNGKSVVVRLNDRGPFIAGRNIDLTPAAARRLGFEGRGLAPVEIEVLSVGDSRWRIR